LRKKSGVRTNTTAASAADYHSGLSERCALRVLRMSASALHFDPAPNRNASQREGILALAHRHRRYGASIIYLKVRHAGLSVNHKRVDPLYALAKLAGATAQAQKDAHFRTAAAGSATDSEQSMVDGFRVRSRGRRPCHQMFDDRG
jgi:hypothetical protein